MDIKLYRQVLQNSKAIARLQPRQDSVYDDTALATSIATLSNRINSLQNQLAALDIPDEETVSLPAWTLNKLASDIAVSDVAGATEILTLGVAPNTSEIFIVADVGSISASAAGVSGTLDLLIDGVIKSSKTFTVGTTAINFRVYFNFALGSKGVTLSLELTTNTASQTITVNGSQFETWLAANG